MSVKGWAIWEMTNDWERLGPRGRRPYADFERREVALWQWELLREWFRTRKAALYWQERTQRGLCADLGQGRAQGMSLARATVPGRC